MRRIGVLLAWPRTIPKDRPALGRSCRRCNNWAGPTAAISKSFIALPTATLTAHATYAAELVALAPDLVLDQWRLDRRGDAAGDPHRAGRVRGAADPVGAGFVDSLARPGGNATGFTSYEYSMGGKWLELLKEIAPGVKRVAVLRDPADIRRGRSVRRDPDCGARSVLNWHRSTCATRLRSSEASQASRALGMAVLS